MKKLSFLALAAVGLLFGACASNDALEEKEQKVTEVEGGSFFNVNINLPTTSPASTRAEWEATHLDDGLNQEYAVDNVLLLLFEGTSETTAQLVQVIKLDASGFAKVTDDPNQITTNKKYTAQLNEKPTNKLYALAVINGTGVIEQSTADNKILVKGVEKTSPKLADLQAATVASANVNTSDFIYKKDGKDYFFMTNAVLFTKQGGSVDPGEADLCTTLVEIPTNCIFASEAAAELSTAAAADIYVERGVAKVTIDGVTSGAVTVDGKIKTYTDGAVTATFNGWTLDQTNKSSYIVRNVPNIKWNLTSHGTVAYDDKYRFVGNNAVDKYYGTAKLWRTYWAEDPNYDTDWATGNFSQASFDTDLKAIDVPLYCLENTFDVEHMTFNNTTRVVVKVTMNSGNDFYTVGKDRKTLYTADDIKNRVISNLKDQASFNTWFNTNYPGKTLDKDKMTITWSSTSAGTTKVNGISITIESTTKTVEAANITALNTQLGLVKLYKGGATYYQLRIKHFGDELTPWNNGEYTSPVPTESGISNIYPSTPGRDANYLGRYGMVRNNWYLLTINKIEKIGSTVPTTIDSDTPPSDPTDPDTPDPEHPDDELDDVYINARINILSWAKRPQTWNLKN